MMVLLSSNNIIIISRNVVICFALMLNLLFHFDPRRIAVKRDRAPFDNLVRIITLRSLLSFEKMSSIRTAFAVNIPCIPRSPYYSVRFVQTKWIIVSKCSKRISNSTKERKQKPNKPNILNTNTDGERVHSIYLYILCYIFLYFSIISGDRRHAFIGDDVKCLYALRKRIKQQYVRTVGRPQLYYHNDTCIDTNI